MFTAKRDIAREALAAGIVTGVATGAVLDRAITRAHARQAKPRHAIAAIKRGLYANTIHLLLGAANG